MVEVLEIAFLAVAKRQRNTQRHESNRWEHKYHDAFADSSLAILGGRLSRTVAHGTSLAKSRCGPQEERQDEKRGANSHFTSRSMIRRASGKKKMVIKIRHRTTEVIVSHFMRDTSYFKCMK